MAGYGLEALLRLMQNLRDPEHGCPWDRKQTLASIVPHTLDEVYEVIDTIERQDYPHLRDELGDLLFQVVFYAQICAEAGEFDFNDVVQGLVEKLLRRHPHVFPAGTLESFGAGCALSEAEIKANWERIKAEERAQKAMPDEAAPTEASPAPDSVLEDVAPSLPALLRAHKLQKRAASVGFDWQSLAPVLDTLDSEVQELREAVASGDADHIAEELGDLFFSGVNLARHLKLDAEQVLRGANRKFESRFRRVETLAAEQGMDMRQADEAELDRLWEQAKAELRKKAELSGKA
ncbi:nucleoside triphosphate pyrophosphohydrolase [Motiliproteus sp. SC1-56]|uniref:nucleoside triphosphate pyrophosphohydrolase n=1 Tax=Motiliproteus sp. SC1-56 TaxID=2799565 RepID=UPI001A90C398|nr:nucleoside triphosphate pyrophosphohydrolase [Motiliproteus sp. SC1-56]